jgi:hypothetical protein
MAWKANLGSAYTVSILAITLLMIWGSVVAILVMLPFRQLENRFDGCRRALPVLSSRTLFAFAGRCTIKSQRTELVPVSPDDLRILIDMGLVEMRDEVPVVTPAGYAEIS